MGTVKGSGSLSLENDVLPNLHAAAPSDGGATIGSNAVSMSDFYESVAGGAPASGAISFSDFYSVNNEYDVGDFSFNTHKNSIDTSDPESGPQTQLILSSTSITNRIAYRYGNRSTSTAYQYSILESTDDPEAGPTTWATRVDSNRSTNTLAFHYSTYS